MKIILRLILFLAAFSISAAHAQKKKSKQEKAQEAIAEADKKIARADAQLAIMRNAYKYLQNKEYDSMIIMYSRLLEIQDSTEMLHTWSSRGGIYNMIGEPDLAIADYSRVIRYGPEGYYNYISRGHAYISRGELDSALNDFDHCVQLDPKNAQGYHGRGYIFQIKGEYERAIKDFEASLPLDTMKLGYFYLAQSYIHLQDFVQAKKCYDEIKKTNWGKKFLEREDNGYYAFYVKAVSEAIPSGENNKAIELLDSALKKFNLEYTDMQRGNFSFKLLIASVLTMKGYAFEKLNKLNEAKDYYNQSLVINQNQPIVIYSLKTIKAKLAEIAKNDKTPPVIELISPQPTRSFDIESDNGATQITGRAKDESGIASIKINGKNIEKVEEDGFFITNLTLKPGANAIAIIATDKQGNTSAKTFTLTGAAVAKKKDKELDIPVLGDVAPKYYAILIAEKDYMDASIPDLQNPVKDARDLKSILESQYSFPQNNIDTLYNRSREDIMQVIVQRCNTLTDNDNLVIFYAGHGTAEKDKYGDVDGYWIPVNAKKGQTSSYISAEDLNKSLKRSNAKHILVIADACFSGAFTRSLPGDAGKTIQKQYKVNSRKIMASGNLEPVPDNSKFLYYLKKNLQENPEKYLSAKDLFDSFYKAIINNTENLPQYAAIKNVGDEGGEFVFIKK